MKLFSTLFKNFLKTVFKTVLNFQNFFELFKFCLSFALLCDKIIVIIMYYLFRAPIAPRHESSRQADRHARCAASHCFCIGYRNATLLLPTAKARTLCVYIVKNQAKLMA